MYNKTTQQFLLEQKVFNMCVMEFLCLLTIPGKVNGKLTPEGQKLLDAEVKVFQQRQRELVKQQAAQYKQCCDGSKPGLSTVV